MMIYRKTVKIEMYLMNDQVPSNMIIQYTTDYGVMKLQVDIILFSDS